MGFIKKYLLPEEIDFNLALLEQARISRSIIHKLLESCQNENGNMLSGIPADAHSASQLKTQNMTKLQSVFITPYDKESIYRMITQLEWIALSVKHFHLETEAYDMHSLGEYESILETILKMATALEDGVSQLPAKKLQPISSRMNQIYDQYDRVVKACAHASANLLAQDDIKRIIRHKDMLRQLKEIARRIHITANTLEDMTIKIL